MTANQRGEPIPSQELIDAVIGRIKQDIEMGDWTAIDELLTFVPVENLLGFLPEERWPEFQPDTLEV